MAPLLTKLTSASHFPAELARFSAFIKHNILAFDVYHLSRMAMLFTAITGKAPGNYKHGLTLLDYSKSDLAKALALGRVTQKEVDWANASRGRFMYGMNNGLNAAKILDALYAEHVPIIPLVKQVNHYIFQKFSRGAIVVAYVSALDRNVKARFGNATFDSLTETQKNEVSRYTAKEINTFFRNLGDQGLFASKTFQDMSRSLFFAPQWTEGGIRSDLRGLGQLAKAPFTGKVGNIGLAMGTGLVASFAAAQVINMITRGKPTWDNDEPGHELDVWIPDAISGSKGYFISPLSVFNETVHDFLKYGERDSDPLAITNTIAGNKMHPVARSFKTLIGGEDWAGRKLEGLDRWKEAGMGILPVPIFAHMGEKRGGLQKQLISLAGQKADMAHSSTADSYALAAKWKEQNHIKVTSFGESPYAKLRTAIQNEDAKGARREYEKLLLEKKPEVIDQYFRDYPTRPITGSDEAERKFKKTLTPGQRRIYAESQIERQKLANFYRAKVRKRAAFPSA
jgi:hypothetical protein